MKRTKDIHMELAEAWWDECRHPITGQYPNNPYHPARCKGEWGDGIVEELEPTPKGVWAIKNKLIERI